MALPTTIISGTVSLPSGASPGSANYTAILSTSGTAIDPATGNRVQIAGPVTATVDSSGHFSIALVPNDIISPAGTYYTVTFAVPMTGGTTFYSPDRWTVPSSSSGLDVGDVPRGPGSSAPVIAGPKGADGAPGAQGPAGAAGNPSSPWASVITYGADRTGIADSTAAFASAIAAVTSGHVAGTVYVPTGTYKVSASTVVSNVAGLVWLGDGRQTTQIIPTAALQGLPVFKLVNCRECRFEALRIHGNGANPPDCAIEINVNAPSSIAPTCNTLRSVHIGSDSASSLAYGVRITAAVGYDQNNDQNLLEDVSIDNVGVGLSIEHSNSLLNDLVHVSMQGVTTAVKVGPSTATGGGSFRWFGGFINGSGWDFDLAGTARHTNHVYGVASEGGSNLIKSSTDAGWRFYLDGYTKVAATGGNVVDYQSVGGVLVFRNSLMSLGAATAVVSVPDSGSTLMFETCRINFTGIAWGGAFISIGNYNLSGGLPETPSGGATKFRLADSGGGMSLGNLEVTALPSSAPAAGSKRFWYDPADGNRIKFVP